jgi:hypothetical protein
MLPINFAGREMWSTPQTSAALISYIPLEHACDHACRVTFKGSLKQRGREHKDAWPRTKFELRSEGAGGKMSSRAIASGAICAAALYLGLAILTPSGVLGGICALVGISFRRCVCRTDRRRLTVVGHFEIRRLAGLASVERMEQNYGYL